MRLTPAKLLLGLAFLLITLPAFGAETRGVKHVVIYNSSERNVQLIDQKNPLMEIPCFFFL